MFWCATYGPPCIMKIQVGSSLQFPSPLTANTGAKCCYDCGNTPVTGFNFEFCPTIGCHGFCFNFTYENNNVEHFRRGCDFSPTCEKVQEKFGSQYGSLKDFKCCENNLCNGAEKNLAGGMLLLHILFRLVMYRWFEIAVFSAGWKKQLFKY